MSTTIEPTQTTPPIVKRSSEAYVGLAYLGGGLLLLAGVVKLAFTGPPPPSTVTAALIPDWAMALVPAYEIALGLWLISGRLRFGAWLLTLLTLALFSLVNLDAVSAGKSSCGCLGPVSPTPGVMLALDVAAGMLFLKCRPGWTGWPAASPGLRLAGMTAAAVALTLGTVGAIVYARYGSVTAALADARGDLVAAVPGVVDAGLTEPDGQVERTITLHNLSAAPVHVYAARANCNCADIDGLPLTVDAGGKSVVTIRVRLPHSPGSFARKGVFLTSAGKVPFGIRGVVRGVPETGGKGK